MHFTTGLCHDSNWSTPRFNFIPKPIGKNWLFCLGVLKYAQLATLPDENTTSDEDKVKVKNDDKSLSWRDLVNLLETLLSIGVLTTKKLFKYSQKFAYGEKLSKVQRDHHSSISRICIREWILSKYRFCKELVLQSCRLFSPCKVRIPVRVWEYWLIDVVP